jgi:hypothetical protein
MTRGWPFKCHTSEAKQQRKQKTAAADASNSEADVSISLIVAFASFTRPFL